jgi:enoyl-CoA hydratase/carnithine racemase
MRDVGQVLIDEVDGIATLRLSNPQRRNAISIPMWEALAAFAQELKARPDIRVVVVRGDGDSTFSAGADISQFGEQRSDKSQGKQYDDLVENACRMFEAIAQPTLAVVRGPCIGAGLSIAASCDLILAAQDGFFAVPAAKLGLGYDSRGVERFLRAFGLSATRGLLYTAERLSAERAYTLGVVHTLVECGRFDEAVAELARGIAVNAPLTLRAAKTAIRALSVARDASLLAQANRLAEAADGSADYAEGRRAFVQKRAPRFCGN